MRFLTGFLTGVAVTVAIPILWFAYTAYSWSSEADARMWLAVTDHYRPAQVSKNQRIVRASGIACFDLTVTIRPGITANKTVLVSGNPDDNNWDVSDRFATMADCKRATIG